MKKLISGFILVALFLFVSNLSAQQWTDAQKEVWKAVETYNDLANKGDLEGFYSYFHDTYCGWSYSSDVPMGKASVKKSIDYWFPLIKVEYSNIVPLKIWVKDDFAFVHYVYSYYSVDKEGKGKAEKGRWTDILMKVDGKWMMVGDHGGETK